MSSAKTVTLAVAKIHDYGDGYGQRMWVTGRKDGLGSKHLMMSNDKGGQLEVNAKTLKIKIAEVEETLAQLKNLQNTMEKRN